jgi:hypothetical protein
MHVCMCERTVGLAANEDDGLGLGGCVGHNGTEKTRLICVALRPG